MPPITYPTAEQTTARAQVLARNAEQMFAFFETNARANYLAPWEFARIAKIYQTVSAELKAASSKP